MEILLLMLIGIVALTVLFFLVIWNFVFGQSLRKMIMTFVGIAVDRTALVDPDAPIDIRREDPLSKELERKAEATSFDDAFKKAYPPEVPKAQIPPDERGELAVDTSDNGWPRALDEETRGEPRAFLNLHLRTEYEQASAAEPEKDPPSGDVERS